MAKKKSFETVKEQRSRRSHNCPCGAPIDGHVLVVVREKHSGGGAGKHIISRSASFCESCALDRFDYLSNELAA